MGEVGAAEADVASIRGNPPLVSLVLERVPHVFPSNGHNECYLRTKANRISCNWQPAPPTACDAIRHTDDGASTPLVKRLKFV